jgi:hypothetical protein
LETILQAMPLLASCKLLATLPRQCTVSLVLIDTPEESAKAEVTDRTDFNSVDDRNGL